MTRLTLHPDKTSRRVAVLSAVAGLSVLAAHPASAAPAPAGPDAQGPKPASHRIVILVDNDNETAMHHAVAYAVNLDRYYAAKSNHVEIEIVANGSGIRMFRADTSPLKEPLAALSVALPNVTYSVCNSSKLIAEGKEGHAIPLLPQARLVPFGIGRLIDLQEAGWTYVHA